eukprot:31316-Pelagococcus_subviridis.AAC.3
MQLVAKYATNMVIRYPHIVLRDNPPFAAAVFFFPFIFPIAFAAPSLRKSLTPHPGGNALAIVPMMYVLGPVLNTVDITAACIGAFTSPLPMSTAPRNDQNGIMNVPQQIPHKSNAAFGQDDIATNPQNPCVFMNEIIHTLQSCIFRCIRVISPTSSFSRSYKSSFSFPAVAAR